MSLIYSMKLLGNNFLKALKFSLYYLLVLGICAVIFLPCFYVFKPEITSTFNQISVDLFGVFKGSYGENMHNLIFGMYDFVVTIFAKNIGMAIYGLIVIFLILPFLINIGKFVFGEMIYFYMTSTTNVGFAGALLKTLGKSIPFAIVKTFHNLILFAASIAAVYGLAQINNQIYLTYFLPIVETVALVLLFSLYHMLVLGWESACIVFGCGVFAAYKKSFRAVSRHFFATFSVTMISFLLFWLFVMVFGVYSIFILFALLTTFMCVFNMVVFFTSQGMRFYYTSKNILTPKKLEEVDTFKKTINLL